MLNLVLTRDETESIIRTAIRQAMPTFPFGWFSVCPVIRAADVLDIKWYGNSIYNLLSTFHTVDYFSIPKSIRKRMPGLINDLLRDECVSEIAELEILYKVEDK